MAYTHTPAHTYSHILTHKLVAFQQVSCWQHVASNMQLKRRRKRSQASKIALLSTLALNLSLYLSHWLALSLSVVGCNLLRPILPLCVITLLPFSLHYFAFIRGNFVLLLAARQHPSAYVCVSFGALSAISSLTLYFSLSLSVSTSL